MMDTPICDFVRTYRDREGLRLHMPGHKGREKLGPEALDITEIAGADELYHARGIIQKSEANAASLFGASATLYSTEGSSLCIRAMVRLALLDAEGRGRRPLILAGRNAHQPLLSACALLDAKVQWLYPENEESLISCEITADGLEEALAALKSPPAAVYVTSPDYLGNMLDTAALARTCHRHGVPLLVDNAHGAYLKFLPQDQHPLTLGADLCCDSAHKTLPVLTGGAYLHIGPNAPDTFRENAAQALALFASTSPSYLVLQSLDQCNAYLAGPFREELAHLAERMEALKARLREKGYTVLGREPIKLTLAPKAYGYTGQALHDLLRERNMECEFADPDFLTAMLTPQTKTEEIQRLEQALLQIPPKAPILTAPPPLPRPRRVLSIRRAMLARQREIPVDKALGRILASAHVGCPPCIPILACGERIDQAAIRCFRYYGVASCRVVEEGTAGQ